MLSKWRCFAQLPRAWITHWPVTGPKQHSGLTLNHDQDISCPPSTTRLSASIWVKSQANEWSGYQLSPNYNQIVCQYLGQVTGQWVIRIPAVPHLQPDCLPVSGSSHRPMSDQDSSCPPSTTRLSASIWVKSQANEWSGYQLSLIYNQIVCQYLGQVTGQWVIRIVAVPHLQPDCLPVSGSSHRPMSDQDTSCPSSTTRLSARIWVKSWANEWSGYQLSPIYNQIVCQYLGQVTGQWVIRIPAVPHLQPDCLRQYLGQVTG